MGKIKAREKLHISAPKSSEPPNKNVPSSAIATSSKMSSSATEIRDKMQFISSRNLFSGFKIDVNGLSTKLIDSADTDSTVYMKTARFHMKKGMQRSLKRGMFLRKLEATRISEQKRIEEEKRKATPVVGDMQPLRDAILSLQEFQKNNETPRSCTIKPRPSRSFKQQRMEMMKDIETYHQVLSASKCSSNPIDAITTHLKSLVQAKML